MAKRAGKRQSRRIVAARAEGGYAGQLITRSFRRFMGWNGGQQAIGDAMALGEAAGLREVTGKLARNPYPPGRRHAAFEHSRRSADAYEYESY